MLENPCGDGVMTGQVFSAVVQKIFAINSTPVIFADAEKKKPLQLNGDNLVKLSGKTVYV